MEELWAQVDAYLNQALIPSDPALEAALADSAAGGLPQIAVAPNQGKLLNLLARLCGARRILEIGTLGAYSTIWLARALPADGRLVSLEAEAQHAEVARANLERAGLAHLVEIRLGPALASLAQVGTEAGEAFDLFFIDADKAGIPDYLAWSLRLSRPGSLVVVDNMVSKGAILEAASEDPGVQGRRRALQWLGSEPRLDATAIQTVGSKGHDGFLLALVT